MDHTLLALASKHTIDELVVLSVDKDGKAAGEPYWIADIPNNGEGATFKGVEATAHD